MSDKHVLAIHTDGAARGNPGPAAFAYVISRPGHAAIEDHGCLGEATNNVAEYTAIVKALHRARQLGGQRLVVNSDSELIVKQMQGKYKVKNEGLRPLHDEVRRLTEDFDSVTFQHIPREQNRRADALCNKALDGANSMPAKKPPKVSPHSGSTHVADGPKAVALAAGVRHDILECLRAVACAWSTGNPNHPKPEEVWDQLWTILEEAGALKTGHR